MAAKTRNIGIPWIKPPENTCDDPKCPWHGRLPVRGILIEGRIEKIKMKNTAVITRDYLHFVPKYKRYERRRSKIHAHLPPCIEVKPGDKVIIGETRPLAKSVAFVVLSKVE
ncbi:MAG: 30S ribosomal protein S17 [Thermoprotei archaeon]|nr:30S ribosomal protein S17 [Thermoproteales archaeon]RLE74248.1 MAG: 30S ribosomal protein S17 [Thermoprotei archaeon]RLE77614.1 MAG: 30S ribosomal protein S17 [Thermoprotei archaeon]RLE84543.1 MAG: 30S ribosomal protein S17 [Thermoprotei archaeon]